MLLGSDGMYFIQSSALVLFASIASNHILCLNDYRPLGLVDAEGTHETVFSRIFSKHIC